MLNESLRIAIAGATSLRGKDLAECIEESAFPVGEVRLLDEELAAGTVTEVAGEAAIVLPIDETSFERQRFVFFTGTPGFSVKNAPSAERAGATVIDLSGGLAGTEGARFWIPQLDVSARTVSASKSAQGQSESLPCAFNSRNHRVFARRRSSRILAHSISDCLHATGVRSVARLALKS